MRTTGKVHNIGTSLYVHVPSNIVRALNIQKGDYLEYEIIKIIRGDELRGGSNE